MYLNWNKIWNIIRIWSLEKHLPVVPLISPAWGLIQTQSSRKFPLPLEKCKLPLGWQISLSLDREWLYRVLFLTKFTSVNSSNISNNCENKDNICHQECTVWFVKGLRTSRMLLISLCWMSPPTLTALQNFSLAHS